MGQEKGSLRCIAFLEISPTIVPDDNFFKIIRCEEIIRCRYQVKKLFLHAKAKELLNNP